MASGNTIFVLHPYGSVPPTTAYATLDVVVDASTPPIPIPVLDFDTTTAETAYWIMEVPSNYAGGGFTWKWKGGTDLANTGTLQLDLRIKKIADATIMTSNLGIASQTASSISDTPPATPINKLNYSATATLSHANAGSPSAGDFVIIALTRNVATDTNTGDLQLALATISEA